jgi:hypothetical protein
VRGGFRVYALENERRDVKKWEIPPKKMEQPSFETEGTDS